MRLGRLRSGALVALVASLAACQQVPSAPASIATVWKNAIPTPPPPPPPPPPPQLLVTKILTFGDSLTEGDATPDAIVPTALNCPQPGVPGIAKSYPAKMQALLAARYTAQTITVYNAGCGGERADEAGFRLRDVIRQLQPQLVILLEGVNDLNQGSSLNTAADGVDDLMDVANREGVKIILSTLPPQSPNRGSASTLVQPFNALLGPLAIADNASLVDIYPLLTLDMVAPDGLHLTQAGNDVLANAFFGRIKSLYEVAGDQIGEVTDSINFIDCSRGPTPARSACGARKLALLGRSATRR